MHLSTPIALVSTGLLWCVTFVVLESAQAVFFGGVFQRTDAFLVGTCVFGLTTAASLAWTRYTAAAQLGAAFAERRSLIGLNVTAAGAWLAYLLSIQMIEPAVAFTLFSGSVPLTTLVAARWGVPEAFPARNAAERTGALVVTLALASLSVTTLAGLSGFVRGGALIALIGIGLALASGAFIAAMLFYGHRLNAQGVGPVAQFGLRFPLYLALSLAATFLGLDAKGPIRPGDLAQIVGVGLVVMAFPAYAVQKAVSLVPPLTIASVTALGPSFVFLFQRLEGRVDHAPTTLAGLAVYGIGAVVAAVGTV